jgi:hypothetical protein
VGLTVGSYFNDGLIREINLVKVTPISGEICFIGSMKLSIPSNSSHETIRVCTATRVSVKIKKLSRNLGLGSEIAPIIQSYRMFCFHERQPSFNHHAVF